MPRYAITTFGCQMNVHDSERMHDVLRRAGYAEAGDPDEADVLVLNTCSVREKAEQKLRSEVGRLARWKRERPDRVLVVAGCVAQQEGERLLKQMRAIDMVVGPDNIPELPGLLGDLALGGLPIARTVFDTEAPRFLAASPPQGASGRAPTAFVTIMKGCDERCSFCVVPYTRGPERYRPSDEIVAEIAGLVAAGTREVTLLGQTVNSYRDPLGALPAAPGASPDDPDESEFAALLRRIAADVPGLARLRYTSPHPRHLTPSLILAHAELAVLPRHVHLPVQSGSDRVLRRMIRRYTRAEYVARTRALAAAVPGLSLSTDIIVGFPGETEDDFAATLSLVREVGFKGLFGFKYSRRPHTPALRLADDVPEDVKGARLSRLFEESEALLSAHLQGLVGTTQEVLVEGRDKERGHGGHGGALWSGRTGRHEIAHVEGAEELDLLGEIVEVAVVRANKHSLQAELTEAARAAARPRQRGGEEPGRPARRALPVLSAEGG
ncbi:dimethylallyladenosine tRNA methylthiotransferase [Sorangium cellulosum]|uniref:tRNA-2-methylthio-N(6)-dimethylallyladenosine synthase n=1 Tax=Sorangium cellulosum TaxID=56 RepID=A0A4P2Q4U2_SORCE|nr:tRNA (N6-isopentenyl adenosine(37)-C2)-methylthiotransferase MiaB [Sorangium cellulosum]AUX24390.1 dimethylallyladenosine tRNA methylthiotransferase [Sorangium cellulosum]